MQELPSEENLYLRSLIETKPDRHLQQQISDVCTKHKDNPLYKQYLNHFVKTATKNGGDTNMLLDPIFDEMDAIEKRTREEDKAYYQPQIDFLTDSCQQLTAQIQQLQNLLAQNNIPFNQGVNRWWLTPLSKRNIYFLWHNTTFTLFFYNGYLKE